MTGKEKKALAEAREESRKVTKRAFMSKRLDEAQHLLGNILTDKPELPKDLPTRVITPKRKTAKERSPVSVRDRKPLLAGKKERSPVRKPQGILKTREVNLPYVPEYEDYGDLDLDDDWLMEDQLDEQEPVRYPAQPMPDTSQLPPRQISVQPAKEPAKGKKSAGLVPKLKLSLEDVNEEEPLKLQQTGETTGVIKLYVTELAN